MNRIIIYPDFVGVDVKEKEKFNYPIENISLDSLLRNEIFKDDKHFSSEKMKNYLKSMSEKLEDLPPILIVKNPIQKNKYNILDGHHRFQLHKELGKKTISSQVVDYKNVFLVKEKYGTKNNTAIRLDKVNPNDLDLNRYFNTEINQEIDEKWSEKYKKSIDCNNPKGFSQRAHCQGKKKKETKEMTGADSAGAFSGPLIGKVVKKKEIYKIPNFDLNEEEEFKEATDASSMGSYDVPLFGKSPKGNKDPLKISGLNSIYKGRAVKDKKFPRFGGPKGIYVKVKEKCKKFPYCNQGNTGALEFISEDEEIRSAIQTTSKKYGIPLKEVEKLVLNQIKQIFI